MATIFRKTDKGQAEIETRAHRLPPRLRSALILVDGRRSSAELRTMVLQQPDETLAALLEQGFIAAVAEAPPPAPTPSRVAERAIDRAAAASLPAAERGPDFLQLRRLLVREFNDLTGPTGEVLAMRLEKAADRNALTSLLPAACEFVAGVRGASKASEFRQRFAEQLESA